MANREFEGDFEIRHEHGLHARPAGQFVTLAVQFNSEIAVSNGSEWVPGDSVLSLLSLAATMGTSLKIRAVGSDAHVAVRELGRLIENPEGSV